MNIQFYKIFKIINRNAISRWLYRTPLWRTCREQVLLDSEAEACGSMRRRRQVSLRRLLLRLQEGQFTQLWLLQIFWEVKHETSKRINNHASAWRHQRLISFYGKVQRAVTKAVTTTTTTGNLYEFIMASLLFVIHGYIVKHLFILNFTYVH